MSVITISYIILCSQDLNDIRPVLTSKTSCSSYPVLPLLNTNPCLHGLSAKPTSSLDHTQVTCVRQRKYLNPALTSYMHFCAN